MYCPYCGTQIVEDSSFCTYCGRPITSASANKTAFFPAQSAGEFQVQQYQMQKNAARKSELDSLNTAISHFSQKAARFVEYDTVCKRLNYYARGAKSALLVWGCIIFTIALLVAVILITEGSADEGMLAMLLFLVPGVMMITGGILMKVNNRRKYAKTKQRYAELSKELYNHYLACPNCPVGAEYTNPEILKLFRNVLESGRADTVKESINLVVDMRHQKQVQEYLAMVAKNTTEINAATRVAAFFAAASFFV